MTMRFLFSISLFLFFTVLIFAGPPILGTDAVKRKESITVNYLASNSEKIQIQYKSEKDKIGLLNISFIETKDNIKILTHNIEQSIQMLIKKPLVEMGLANIKNYETNPY